MSAYGPVSADTVDTLWTTTDYSPWAPML